MPFALTTFGCSIDRYLFHTWISKVLLPELPADSVIVMDNATFYKRLNTIAAIENAAYIVLWLPPFQLLNVGKKTGQLLVWLVVRLVVQQVRCAVG